MDRINRIEAFRIMLIVALEDAANASTMFLRMVALGEARAARRTLAELGAVA